MPDLQLTVSSRKFRLIALLIGVAVFILYGNSIQNEYQEQIDVERKRYRQLLSSIFPPSIVDELAAKNTIEPKSFDNVAVLFTDIVDFTRYCNQHQAREVVENLQKIVELWEDVATKTKVQKIKKLVTH